MAKTLNIKSDTANLNYARLIPTKRETGRGKNVPSTPLRSVSLSPAGNFLMGFMPKINPILTIGDIHDTNKDKEKFTEHALGTSVLAGYSLSSDNQGVTVSSGTAIFLRYALVKHSYPVKIIITGVRWLVFDRENSEKIIDVSEAAHENEPRLAVPSCHGRAMIR